MPGARLHLDETENIGVPADQIDFAASARRTEITCDDHVASLAQMEVSRVFPLPSFLQMWRKLRRIDVGPRGTDKRVRQAKSQSCEARAHAVMVIAVVRTML